MKTHGGKREGAGRKPSPFLSGLVTVAFLNEVERAAFMALSPRERVALALFSQATYTPQGESLEFAQPRKPLPYEA